MSCAQLPGLLQLKVIDIYSDNHPCSGQSCSLNCVYANTTTADHHHRTSWLNFGPVNNCAYTCWYTAANKHCAIEWIVIIYYNYRHIRNDAALAKGRHHPHLPDLAFSA